MSAWRDIKPVDPVLAVGVPVRITAGLAKGVEGTVLAVWPGYFGTIPLWRIGCADYERVIRQDFLQRVSP